MKRNRQSKMMAILALCVSVVGLTLGFAAFSNTLTISSSATVSPKPSDFDINVYGFMGASNDSFHDLELYSSSTISRPKLYQGTEQAKDAKITDSGKSVIISDLAVNFNTPGDGAWYHFLIKNEGQYDAYLDLTKLQALVFENGGVAHTCTADTGTSVDLVNATCKEIFMYGDLTGPNYHLIYIDPEESTYKLVKGSHIYLSLYIDYGYSNGVLDDDIVRADGNFSVDFDDIVLEFTTVAPTE